jgi:hypothetical protein
MANGNVTAGLENVPLEEIERRLADARANNQAARIFRLETRIAEIKGTPKPPRPRELALPGAAPAARPGPKVAKIAPADREAIVREAYLRTLSRKPLDSEVEAAVGYLGSTEDGAKGMRDLLWALLNTKEFITNH